MMVDLLIVFYFLYCRYLYELRTTFFFSLCFRN